MKTNKLQQQAKRLHTHRVVFTANDDIEVAIRALLGQSTRAICGATKLNPGQVQYRVKKAGINRWAFRHGETELSQRIMQTGRKFALSEVERDIQPKFIGLSK